MKRLLLLGAVGLFLCAPFSAKAEVTDPLLKTLVDKGTLSSQEAEDIQSKKTELPSALKGLSIGGLAYIDFSSGSTGGASKSNYNRFTLQRGYININKEITPWFKARITPDIKTSSSTTGDYTIRLKYLYADFLTPDQGPLTSTDFRVGLGQTPWLDFEEALNTYRMQSTMFQDKRGLQTSSDLGISVLGSLGGKLTKEQIAEVGNGSYAGRYGSYHLGVYNGGGYGAATENNQDKSLQGRLTVRPLTDILPGLQLTYFGITGKGNTNDSVTVKPQQWLNNTGFISYQYKYAVLSAEYFTGKGSNGGDTSTAKKKKGYSVFGKFTLPMYEKVSLFARYDTLDPNRDVSNDKIKTTIGGASYRIYGENYLVAAYERTRDQTKPQDDKKGQVVLQVSF